MSTSSTSSIGTITVPLTTIFTPPAWCDDLLYTYTTQASGTSHFIRDANGPGNGIVSSCYPPDFGVFKTGISSGIYSPGVCPSGWYATTIAHSRIDPTVSWSMCCPTGFFASLYAYQGWSCQSLVTTPTTVALNENTFIHVSSDILVGNWPIFIAWQSSDLDKYTPLSAPLVTAESSTTSSTKIETISPTLTKSRGRPSIASRTASPTSKSMTESVATPSSQTTRVASNTRIKETLSTIDKIGIGIGIAGALLAIIIFLIFGSLWRRRRRRRVSEQTSSKLSVCDQSLSSERHEAPDRNSGVFGRHEASDRNSGVFGRHEAYCKSGIYERHEAPFSPVRAELHTSWHDRHADAELE